MLPSNAFPCILRHQLVSQLLDFSSFSACFGACRAVHLHLMISSVWHESVLLSNSHASPLSVLFYIYIRFVCNRFEHVVWPTAFHNCPLTTHVCISIFSSFLAVFVPISWPLLEPCRHQLSPCGPVAVGDTVLLVEVVQNCIQKRFSNEGTVCCRKSILVIVLSSDLSVKFGHCRPRYLASVDVDMSTSNCFCPNLEPPRLLADTSDSEILVVSLGDPALDIWCSLLTDFSSANRLHHALEQAKFEDRT